MLGLAPSLALLAPSPERWRLKGEGNANWVFSYDAEGAEDALAGKVLRVRKPKPPPPPHQEALEQAVWEPVLGPAAASTAAGREQLYAPLVLAPLMGEEHLPAAQPVQADPAYLHRLLEAAGCLQGSSAGGEGSNGAAANGSGGAPQAAPEAACSTAVLLPDVTLLPEGAVAGPAGQPAAEPAAAPASAGAPCNSRSQQPAGPGRSAGPGQGPVVCLELKPKCGFVGSCDTVHPGNRHLKRHRSRYQLHQMLKLSQGKIAACSQYEPRDLFSGEAPRVRRSLHALMDHPQNNLQLFVDGRPQPLGPALSRHLGGKQQADDGWQQQEEGQQQQEWQQQQQDDGQQQQLDRQQQEASRLGSADSLAGLLPMPEGQQRAALVELLAEALEAEGLLPRLLAAQQQCRYDVEGVYRLYCHLTGTTAGTAAGSAQQAHAAGSGGADGGSGSPASSSRADGEDGGQGSASSHLDESSDEHSTAVQRLLGLSLPEAHAVLRSYVVSATAKDCAIMVTLQRQRQQSGDARADGEQPGDEGTANSKPDGSSSSSSSSSSDGSSHGDPPALQARALRVQRGGAAGVLSLCCPGGTALQYRYRASFVDLDMKPLAKIPAHHELDREIVEAARRHLSRAKGSG